VLLRDAAIRRLPGQPGIHAAAGWQQGLGAYIGAWKQAVHDVHTEYFEEYKNWQRNLCLDVSNIRTCLDAQADSIVHTECGAGMSCGE